MGCYRDAEELYELIGGTLCDLAENPARAGALEAIDAIIRIDYRDPDATITISLRRGEPAAVIYGESDLEPEVAIDMPAELAHRYWQGDLNFTHALARGDLSASGPIKKVLALRPILVDAFPLYRARLEAAGRGDLLAV